MPDAVPKNYSKWDKSRFDKSTFGWCEIDAAGIIVDIDPKLLKLLHLSSEKVLGKLIYEKLVDRSALNYIQRNNFRRSHNLDNIELAFKLTPRHSIKARTKWINLLDAQGQLKSTLILITEILDKKNKAATHELMRTKKLSVSLLLDPANTIIDVSPPFPELEIGMELLNYFDESEATLLKAQFDYVRTTTESAIISLALRFKNIHAHLNIQVDYVQDGILKLFVNDADQLKADNRDRAVLLASQHVQIRLLELEISKSLNGSLNRLYAIIKELDFIDKQIETLLLFWDQNDVLHVRTNSDLQFTKTGIEKIGDGLRLNEFIINKNKTEVDRCNMSNAFLKMTKLGYTCYPITINDVDRGVVGYSLNLKNADSIHFNVIRAIVSSCSKFLAEHEMRTKLTISENFLAGLVSNSDEITVVTDMIGDIKFITPAAERFLGYKVADVINTNIFNFLHADDFDRAHEGFVERIKSGGNGIDEIFRVVCADGSYKYLTTITTNCLEDSAIKGMVINAHDITEMIKLSRENSIMVMRTQEEERRRIARDLHDGLGQSLSATKMFYGALERKLMGRVDEETMAIYTKGKTLLSRLAAETREISHNLIPSPLKEFGLLTTIKDLLHEYAQSNQDISFEFQNELWEENTMSTDVQLAVYRILQELINNAIKHAQCTRIHIKFAENHREYILSVKDDGKGIEEADYKLQHSSGLGMTSIRHRLNVLRGEIYIESAKENGSHFSIHLPKF